MATSSSFGGRVLAWLESRKNLAGSAGGLAGLALTFTGLAGTYWPVVVAGLYGAGALLAPPDRPVVPEFDPAEEFDPLRGDFAALRGYLDEVELPPAAAGRLTELLARYEALLDPGWVADVLATDPEAVHVLARAVRRDLPECVDTYNRARWWNRLQPGAEPPERHLERQLTVLFGEAERLTADLQDREARRQQTHTAYLEERGRS
ncbi:hypothetical protein LG634_25420 [Streptomyces bambusae]|uniref:hypothetical protein n=1 Tax=Streptomyces bambusae TaxID=1550616 RepID=UPI001CFCE88C|nr:hypothetical protein [Streptomyces bambusae]MCB5168157.1 hypothetical protein [Streptomyces bambusae]